MMGATWKDLAAIAGVTARTMRRWRNHEGDPDSFEPGPGQAYHSDSLNQTLHRPGVWQGVERDCNRAAPILAAIAEGHRLGRAELLDKLNQAAEDAGGNGWRVHMALLNPLDNMSGRRRRTGPGRRPTDWSLPRRS